MKWDNEKNVYIIEEIDELKILLDVMEEGAKKPPLPTQKYKVLNREEIRELFKERD